MAEVRGLVSQNVNIAAEMSAIKAFLSCCAYSYMTESSFKLKEYAVLTGRAVFSVPTERSAKLFGDFETLVRRLAMPEVLRSQLPELWQQSDILHIAYEIDENQCVVFKVYFEYAEAFHRHITSTNPQSGSYNQPFQIHTALKWITDGQAEGSQASRGLLSYANAKYWCHLGLSKAQLIKRACYISGDMALSGVLSALIGKALQRVSISEIFFMEVEEPGNPRRSFDLNFYDAELLIKDVQSELTQLAHTYNIDKHAFESLIEASSHQSFGHVSAGQGRDGKSFLSIYYGAKRGTPS